MDKLQRILNSLMILTLCGILLSAFGVQFLWHEDPCPLCLLQRVCMIGVAIGCLLNLRYGIRMSHYGLCLLSALVGGTVALRQISLHVCPAFPKFGLPVLGLSLYTWSFVTFVCVTLAVAVLLFLYDASKNTELNPTPPLSRLDKFAFGLVVFITLANVITTFFQCGFGPCVSD